MVEIKNLTKQYGQIKAVSDISFTANKSEVLGFLGPNGAGKSTTMNMIVGYLPPTDGTITVDGLEISKSPNEVKKKIGYLPEMPPLYMDMKVIEYLNFVAGIKCVPKGERKREVDRAMSRLKITDMKKRVIGNLSKGYKQRVGFAQALIGNPPVLILDEPTVGLDPNQTTEVRNLINMLKKEHTIIFSSHILGEVSAVCDRIVIIDKGVIKAVDTVENLSKDDGKTIISLKVKGEKRGITNVLMGISGIAGVPHPKHAEDDSWNFKLELKDDSTRKEIIAKLTAADFEIVEIAQVKASLEQIFAELTAEKTESTITDEK